MPTSDDPKRAKAPPFHLVQRCEDGVWAAVQQLYTNGEEYLLRKSYVREPPGMFRDVLDQYCWHFPNMGGPLGYTFCSDTADPRWYGILDDLQTLTDFAFARIGGQVVTTNEGGAAAPTDAAPPQV